MVAEDVGGLPQPGSVHAGCLLEGLLGRGGMGSVYLARREADGLPVVVKFLAPELAQQQELRARFRREWESLQRLHPPHPNVVRVLAVQSEGPCPCIVLERVPGETLADCLARDGPLSPRRVAEVGLGVARGLAAVHALGMVHRDVKPGNIMLQPHGDPKIIDFGLAKDLFLSGLTAPGQLLGTAHTMAPEQWEDEGGVDPRSDVWALGATLYQALTGEPAFAGSNVDDIADAILAGDYRRPREAAPHTPPALAEALEQMLMVEPERRYPRMADVAEDLERILAGAPARVPCFVDPQGRRFPLLDGEWFTLGSAAGCAVRVSRSDVAPKHAQLRWQGGGFVLRDLKSAAGTFVDGERLHSGRGLALHDGARVSLGSVPLRFEHPWERAARDGAAWLRDVVRRTEPDPVVEALAAVRDVRAALWCLERLLPERLPSPDDRALAERLGPEVARAVGRRRVEGGAARAAEAAAALAAITSQGDLAGPEAWLCWWRQVHGSAPEQLVPARSLAVPRLRVVSGHAPLELPLEGSVVLVGRDPRCHLRLQRSDLPRLAATLLRLHRRWVVVDEARTGLAVDGRPARAALVDPGATLSLPGDLRLLLVPPPAPRVPSGGPLEVEPESFDALCGLDHPAVAAALVAMACGRARLEAWEARLRALVGEGAASERALAALRSAWEGRCAEARRLLPRLLGAPPGSEPRQWQAALQARRAALGPQVVPWGWCSVPP
ncbi:MAG: FHA domain-containing protein [Planctomycetota bacterium]|nr:MAG: FHA domain-containing protein [Planctomycetota bacterium]